jgi:hypothetical protein
MVGTCGKQGRQLFPKIPFKRNATGATDSERPQKRQKNRFLI